MSQHDQVKNKGKINKMIVNPQPAVLFIEPSKKER